MATDAGTDDHDEGGDAGLERAARGGDAAALAGVFDRWRDRLRKMVRLRLDRRLHGRVDPSDVLQETYLEAARRLPEYADEPRMPLFVWLRFLTAQRLLTVRRRHLGAGARDAGREVPLHRRPTPDATTGFPAAHLPGHLTSPTRAAERAELRLRLRDALDRMDPAGREVLVLRHFEGLSNGEVAAALGIGKTAASNRYVRALARLQEVLGPAAADDDSSGPRRDGGGAA